MKRLKTTLTDIPMPDIQENINDSEYAQVMNENYMRYTFHTMEDRALPDVRDGLKPSQRRILVTMNDLGARGNKKEKCAEIVGGCMAHYHPHGDAAIYAALVRMNQNWLMRQPLVAKQGNFGSIDDDPPAAYRYTEGALSEVGEALLSGLSRDTVDHETNYNDKLQEPTVLPGIFPNLIVNGVAGIAVGMATKMPPHNFKEAAALIRARIKNPKLTLEEALTIMPGPDFPLGGVIRGTEGINSYYATGRGSIVIEGKYEITENTKGDQFIEITELPYAAGPNKLALQIETLAREDKIKGVTGIKNLSVVKGGQVKVHMIVELHKTANPNLVLNQILKSTCLRTSFDVNNTVLDKNGIVQESMPLFGLIDAFIDHRIDVLTRQYAAEVARNIKAIHLKDGLIKVSARIDEVIALIRASDDPDDAQAKLLAGGFVDTPEQATEVLGITLRTLTKLEADKLKFERTKLVERNQYLNDILSDSAKLKTIISKEQEELSKKFGDDRRTTIQEISSDLTAEDLIEESQIVISISRDGYIKRLPVASYKLQARGGKGVNGSHKSQEDVASDLYAASTHDLLLFFTNKGLMYQKKGYELPEATTKTSKGTHFANLLNLKSDERVVSVIPLKSFDSGYIVMVTQNGLIKRTELNEYETAHKQRGLISIKLNTGDEVKFVGLTDGKTDVFIATALGKAVRYSEDVVNSTDRATRGVRSIDLNEGDAIVQVLMIDSDKNPDILVLTELGFGKKSSASEYRSKTGRGGKGVATIDKVKFDRNGLIVGAVTLNDGDTLIVQTAKGKIIHLPSSGIRATGRVAMGVKIVNLDDNDTISSATRIVPAPEITEE